LARLLVAAVLAASVLAACGDDDDDDGGASTSDTTAAAGESGTTAAGATTTSAASEDTATEDTASEDEGSDEPIKIGGIYDLTGPLSFLGEPGAAGAQAYIDELNANGGIDGREVEFILKNGESTSDAAIAGVRELIGEGVVAILGPPSGTTANAVLPIANEAEIPVLSPQGALNLGEGYMFTTSLAGSRTLANFAKFFVDEDITRVGWLVAGDALGQTQSELARPIFDEMGIEVVSEQTINPTATDYTTQLAALRDAGAEAVYAIASGAPVVAAAQGFAALDMPGFILLQNASVAQIPLFGEAAADVRVPQPKVAVVDQIEDDDPLMPSIEAFIAVAEEHGVPIDLFGAGGYSGARIITETIAEVGADPAAIYEHWINSFADDENLAGAIEWTADDHGCCGLNAWVWAVPDPAANRFTVLRPAE
jgi:branched-chain amino acid transport system substrate-binding protein